MYTMQLAQEVEEEGAQEVYYTNSTSPRRTKRVGGCLGAHTDCALAFRVGQLKSCFYALCATPVTVDACAYVVIGKGNMVMAQHPSLFPSPFPSARPQIGFTCKCCGARTFSAINPQS